MSPVIRDNTVIPLTIAVDLSIFSVIDVSRGGDPMLGTRPEKHRQGTAPSRILIDKSMKNQNNRRPCHTRENFLANSAQARKRARQAIGRRSRNVARRSAMRTHIKKFLTLAESGEKDSATTAYQSASSNIDRASQKGLTHRNKAARLKRQLNAKLKTMVAA